MKKQRTKDRAGAAFVELGFVLPIIVMTVLGVIEFSRALEVSQILTAAAREGGRLGMLNRLSDDPDPMNTKVTNDIKHFLASQGLDPAMITVEITDTSVDSNDVQLDDVDPKTDFMVRVTVPYSEVAYTSPWFLEDATLEGAIRMRHE